MEKKKKKERKEAGYPHLAHILILKENSLKKRTICHDAADTADRNFKHWKNPETCAKCFCIILKWLVDNIIAMC